MSTRRTVPDTRQLLESGRGSTPSRGERLTFLTIVYGLAGVNVPSTQRFGSACDDGMVVSDRLIRKEDNQSGVK